MINPNDPVELDGLVVEDASGNRLLAIPTVSLEILRFAAVLQFKRGDLVVRVRVDGLGDRATVPTQPHYPSPTPVRLPNPSPAPSPAPLIVIERDDWQCPGCRRHVDGGYDVCTWCNTTRP